MSAYSDFLERKRSTVQRDGIKVPVDDIHEGLFDWQKTIVSWALDAGRAAIWADTGLGKTRMQVEWARRLVRDGGRALIVAPLAVCAQTVREASKIGVRAAYVRTDAEAAGSGVWVTNYERVEAFDPSQLVAVVLDEASILKQSNGKTRNLLIDLFKNVPYRLACTATPAPNDPEELTNQAAFLGRATRQEMLATYYIHDGLNTQSWRLKGHAHGPLMEWMSQWAVAIKRPSDIGGDDTGFILPDLVVDVDTVPWRGSAPDGELFRADIGGVGGRAHVRRESLDDRVRKTVDLVTAEPDQQWIVWCGLNEEASRVAKAVPGAVDVNGAMSAEEKAQSFLDFADGKIQVLVTKSQMAAFGLNWQNCARMAFCGINDSWESYYQSVRRCWRFGQKRPVHVHIVCSTLESTIAENIARKERQATSLSDELVSAMSRRQLISRKAA